MLKLILNKLISESLRIKRTLQRGDLFLLMFSRKAFKMTICCFMIIYGQLNATPPKEIASLVIKDYKSPLSLNLGVGLRGPLDSYKCWVQDELYLCLPQLSAVSGGGDEERFRLFRLPSGAAVRSYQVLLIVQLRKGSTLRTTRETYCKKYSMKNRSRVVSIA